MQPYSTAIFSYDRIAYPFAEICTAALGDLTTLHDETIARLRVGSERTQFHAQLYAIGDPFLSVYRAFVKHLLDIEAGAYLYQAVPSFRVHLPGNVATGNFHKDSDFNHPHEEINYLVALTPMHNSSSVWIESEPGANDFMPVELRVGQYLRFHGADLMHGSVPNVTGQTRVSFDFRILPKAAYRPTDARTVNAGVSLTLGAYYADGSDL